MAIMSEIAQPYHICVIDIGSPKLGNIGWCLIDLQQGQEVTGTHLDDVIPHIASALKTGGLLLGIEAPLFVPLREDLMLATKARKGEGKRPWSAGAGAQVLALNLPIMIYLFNGIKSHATSVKFCLNEQTFTAKKNEIMLFEALVSGADKGQSHIEDASIMARSCQHFSMQTLLPPSILEPESGVEYFNLAAAALLRCNLLKTIARLSEATPIFKPTRHT